MRNKREPSASQLTCSFLRCSYFTGMSICDKLVVHPSYRHRGHATSMLERGQCLLDKDSVNQGVMPSHMGELLYVGMGNEIISETQIPDDGEVKGFSQRVVVYRAKGWQQSMPMLAGYS